MTRRSTPKINAADARLRRDREMMEHCGNWPQWPALPLLLRNRNSQDPHYCGFLYADGKPTVFLGNLYTVVAKTKDMTLWHDLLKKCETREYINLDELAKEWTVD